MRAATLMLLCLTLAACAGGKLPGEQPAPAAPGSSAAGTAGGGGGGARGGSTTAGARGEPVELPPDPLIQARADCWMKVEGQKALRGIDQRIAYVDRCVADQMKSPPRS